MPFMAPNRPNLALSQLRAVLECDGYPCDILYANLEFAEEIGVDLYAKIAEKFPQELLIGDLIFSPLMYDDRSHLQPPLAELKPDPRYLLGYAKGKKKNQQRREAVVPEEFWDLMPHLRSLAKQFIEKVYEQIFAMGSFDLIGLSLTFNAAPNIALARLIKSRPKHPMIIIGGSCCEGEAGVVLHKLFPEIDFVCRGEGENLLLDLIRHLNGEPKNFANVDGLIWRDGTKTVCNGIEAPRVKILDDLPLPRYDDWFEKINETHLPFQLSDYTLPFESSRGCWYGQKVQCTFCGQYTSDVVYRTKSPERVIAEISDLLKYKIHKVDALDLILSRDYFKNLIPALSCINHNLSIFYEVKSNLTRKQVQSLKEAGIDSIQPGIESLSSSMLKLMRKGCLAYQNIRLLKWAEEFGINVSWNILFGFPREDADEYIRMTQLVPLLTHLPPPLTGCIPVILSRYSPLFCESESLGVSNVKPVHSYELLYPIPYSQMEKLAFFFDFEPSEPLNMSDYIVPLKDAIEHWQSIWSVTCFDCYYDSNNLRLFDTRPIASEREVCLNRNESAVFMACDAGASEESICRVTSLPKNCVSDILKTFVDNHWVIRIDNRYLSLAVFREQN